MSWKYPPCPSAVDSTAMNWPASTALNAPVTISLAFDGNWAQVLPNSETCRYWNVPDRSDVPTLMREPLAKLRLLALSWVAGTAF
jgi:hypothetical protein